MKGRTTNVNSGELNYDSYDMEQYDRDIKAVIPGHNSLHEEIRKIITEHDRVQKIRKVIDLGVGTGLTAESVLTIVPEAKLWAIDFSEQMLNGARKKLKKYDVEFILGDYADISFKQEVDLILSVIGMHHQSEEGIHKVFKKVYEGLVEGGMFILGDLMTYEDKFEAALNDAKHYAYMVEHAHDEKSLCEWAYHHKYLNELFTFEQQIEWLREAGFSDIQKRFQYLDTFLLVAYK